MPHRYDGLGVKADAAIGPNFKGKIPIAAARVVPVFAPTLEPALGTLGEGSLAPPGGNGLLVVGMERPKPQSNRP